MNGFQTISRRTVLLLLVGAATMVPGQGQHEREREELQAEQIEERSDHAAISALRERIKHNEDKLADLKTNELAELKASVDKLWDAHRKTDAIASGTQAQVAFLYTIGRPIGGLLLFIGGIVVTQLVTNFMNRRKAKHSRAVATGRGS